ncbi:MAG: hypothetical protein AB7P48_12665 [Methylocystis sp.]
MRQIDEHKPSRQRRVGLPAGTWSLAALSVAAWLCSVLGAKLLSNMFEPSGAPAPASASRGVEADLRDMAISAPHVEAPAPKDRRGVDRLATGSVPDRRKNGRALTPCGVAGELADH